MTERGSRSETVRLIYEHVRGSAIRQQASADAIDAKAIQLFAAATVVLGLGTFAIADINGLAAFLYVLAAGVYLVAAWAAWHILRASRFQVVDAADRWWPSHRMATAGYVLEQLLDDLAEAAAHNRMKLEEKSGPLDTLLFAAAVEAVFVAGAVIAALA